MHYREHRHLLEAALGTIFTRVTGSDKITATIMLSGQPGQGYTRPASSISNPAVTRGDALEELLDILEEEVGARRIGY